MKEVIIHLGIHKTGSTYLQKIFFPSLPGVRYLTRTEIASFRNYILNEDDYLFNPETARDFILELIDGGSETRTVVISDEEFYANPYQAARTRRRNWKRLVATFTPFELRPIIFIRDQRSLLHSLYLQYVKTGGTATPEEFVSYQKYPLNVTQSYFLFDEYIAELIRDCGSDRVVVAKFEDLRKSQEDVLQRLATFCGSKYLPGPIGVKSNKSLNPIFVPPLRFINHFTKSQKLPFGLLGSLFHRIIRRLLIPIGDVMPKGHLEVGWQDWSEIDLSNERLEKLREDWPNSFL
jgi:hypothetical protein